MGIRYTTALTAAILFFTALACGAWQQEGLASWYGGRFQGRTTASGEPYDMNQMTAAHKTLPFGTLVRVSRLEGDADRTGDGKGDGKGDGAEGRTVTVRINDRGPYAPGRVIDLSRAAAAQLGLVRDGVGRVSITLAKESSPESRRHTQDLQRLQTGAFTSPENAEAHLRLLTGHGFSPAAERAQTADGSPLYRIILPAVPASSVASVQKQLEHLGVESFPLK